jgi:hypothetical protein
MVNIVFQTHFDLNLRQLRILDQTNYASQGISLSDVAGNITVNSPRGIIHQGANYTDLIPNTSLYSIYINLPQNEQGFVRPGTYTITYSVKQTSTLQVVSTTNAYTYSFIIPEIVLTQTPDGYNSTFTSSDDTDYGITTSIVRTHTVTPPSGSGLSTISNSSQLISYPPNIWSGLWSSTLHSVLIYTMSDGLILNLTLDNTSSPTTIFAYNVDMNVIRRYIESLRLDYYTWININRSKAEKIENRILLLGMAYEEYDQALYYNDLTTAYTTAVDIVSQLNDYVTLADTVQINPFNPQDSGGGGHAPVSISSSSYGASISGAQVLSFSLANSSHGGMMPLLSGNSTDYLGGDGSWHSFSVGNIYALKADFTDYDHVRAITNTNITNWSAAFGWGNHASAGYALLANIYTQTQLQTSGQSSVHWDNITNKAAFFDGTWSSLSGKPTFSAVATSGQYNDLSGKPTIFDGTWSSLSGKPTFSTVATSGLYSDLLGLPTLFSGSFVDLSSKPTTLLGYGISDAMNISSAANSITSIQMTGWDTAVVNSHIHANLSILNTIINTGSGSDFLADDGTYKSITFSGISDTQVIFTDGTAISGNANFLFNKITNYLSIPYIKASEIDFGDNTVNVKRTSNDIVFTDQHFSKTLSQLVGGATNYWTTITGGIYYTDYVGVNNPSSLTAPLTVLGNINADNFDSNYFQYSNSNLLLGPSAGALETSNRKLYIADTNTGFPLIYGEFDTSKLQFNADVYIQGSKTLNFSSSVTRVFWTSGDNLTFQDAIANSGNAVTLTSLIDGTYNALKSDFTDYTSVKTITSGNKTTWNKSSVIVTGGSSTSFLAADGSYHTVSSGGVTPTDNIFKWDAGSSYYRPYTDKTEAGGVSSGGKWYLGTSTVTNTNRINFDGTIYPYGVLAIGTISGSTASFNDAVFSNTVTSQVFQNTFGANLLLNCSATSGTAFKFDTFHTLTSGMYVAKFSNNSTNEVSIDYLGNINIPTGAIFSINGTSILHNPLTIGTANGLSLATQVLSMALSSTSTTGALSSTDWNTFNNKKPLQATGLTFNPSSNVIFDKDYQYNSYTVSSNITITASTIGGVALNSVELSLVGDGSHTVSFSGCTADSSSGSFDHTLGAVNRVSLFFDGTTIWYNIPNVVIVEPYLGIPSVNGYVLSSTTTGTRSWVAMSGGSSYIVLKNFYTNVSTSGIFETDLYSYNIPANTLTNNGDKLVFYIYYDVGSSPTGCEFKVYFGGINASDVAIDPSGVGGAIEHKISIIRVSSTVCRVASGIFGLTTSSSIFQYDELTSMDFTISNILKVTGMCATSTITAKFGYIEYKPA